MSGNLTRLQVQVQFHDGEMPKLLARDALWTIIRLLGFDPRVVLCSEADRRPNWAEWGHSQWGWTAFVLVDFNDQDKDQLITGWITAFQAFHFADVRITLSPLTE